MIDKDTKYNFFNSAQIFKGRAYDIREHGSAFFFLLQTSEDKVYSVFSSRPLNLKDYDKVQVKGKSTSEDTISAYEIIKEKDEIINAPFCEVNTHTKMSTFNSIIDPSLLFCRLEANGSKYVGITDINTVSNWPVVEELGRKHGIKPIYGCEISVFDDRYKIFGNVKEYCLIKDLTFVVLDIETNGLNKYCDDILEIGWVILKNGNISSSYSTLIKSENTIKKFVSDLTGINSAMLLNGKTQKEAYEVILDLFKDNNYVFVSQNRFDLSMLRHKIQQLLKIDFLPNFIDSKDIFRVCFPEEKTLSVGELSRSISIDMEREHRALDDAMATAQILKVAMDRTCMWNKSTKDEFIIPTKHTTDYKTIVWAKNKNGLKAIYKMLSIANQKYFYRYPKVPLSLVQNAREDVIVASPMLRNGEIFEKFFFDFHDIESSMFKYDYLLLTPREYISNAFPEDLDSNLKAAEVLHDNILFRYRDKILASSSPMFLNPDEEKIAQALASFGTYDRNSAFKSRYFRNVNEMSLAFEDLQSDVREDILKHNIEKFISSINFDFDIKERYCALGIDRAKEKLQYAVEEAIKTKYPNVNSPYIFERAREELELIEKFGFSDIYLVVSELLNALKKDFNIIIGSRGSVGSSFVAFLLDITEVNALKPHQWCTNCGAFKIFFDQYSGFDIEDKMCCDRKMNSDGHKIEFAIFAGLDGSKIPDIDLNVPTATHDEVMKYVENFLLERDLQSARGGTFITLQRKNAFAYIKRFFVNKGITVSHPYMELCSYKAIGCKLAYGQHPGGIIIFPKGKNIEDYTPLQMTTNEDKKSTVTQYDHGFLSGYVFKLDILAHDDPTTLQSLCDEINIKVEDIAMNNKKILSIFNNISSLYENKVNKEYLITEETNVGTLGIPEFGTVFVRRMLRKCKIKTFADIIRVSGFAHGRNVWTNNAERLLDAKTRTLPELISCRDDLFDLLCKYMPKTESFKTAEFIRKGGTTDNKPVWQILRSEMQKSNVSQWLIESCSKINYLFPKAHASAYVIMAFRIAYFKIYHPIEFYKAFLNRKLKFINDEILNLDVDEMEEKATPLINAFDNEEKNTLQLYEILYEMKLRNINIGFVDLEKSDDMLFTIHDGILIPPFSSIKGLGEKVSSSIKNAREKGIFKNMSDFKQRTKINDTQVKLLQKRGILKLKDTTQMRLF